MAESGYNGLVHDLSGLLESARRASARAVNAVMTATYWEIGRRIVEYEQGGKARAEYGRELLERLGEDLTRRFGRGLSMRNLFYMRKFYLAFPAGGILQTVSAKSPPDSAPSFPLPWSHYVQLLGRTESPDALAFYHSEALRNGWSVRQLQRQIGSRFYERTLRSRNKESMFRKGAIPEPGDAVTPDEEVRDPLVLEFLGLKDEYSESDLEEALIRHLVVIDLKVGKFSSADAGQMHTYLNYAREHWVQAGENPPVGLILSSEGDDALARYALEGLRNKVLAREYRLALPEEERLREEIQKTRRRLEGKSGDIPA